MPATRGPVRVFISSTFRDMQAERDHLVTVVFPELRERLEQLGLAFRDVDLRWGVPQTGADGEKANSWEYCKQWIDRVEPFFVCILGQRYGWTPPAEEIRDDQDRAAYRDLSITEMEIRHAVLSGHLQRRSFLYFRRTAVPATAAPEACEQYVDQANRRRLADLKRAIRHTRRPVRRYMCRWTGTEFDQLDEFGQLVLEDLWSGVLRDERFVSKDAWRRVRGLDPDRDPMYVDESQAVPEELWRRLVACARPAPRDPLDVEAEQMAAFAAARRTWFCGRERELCELSRFVRDDLPAEARGVLVVRALPGQGKSALLAAFAASLGEPSSGDEQPPVVIEHFVGATEHSADPRRLLKRLVLELDRRGVGGPDQGEVRWDLESLRKRLGDRLGAHGGARRIVLIIDAVDQLTSGHDLRWLPETLGRGVRVILSCVNDPAAPGEAPSARVLSALAARGAGTRWLDLGALGEAEVRDIIRLYLEEYCKELDGEQLDALCRMPQARNPLYLFVMLHELRTLGGNETHLKVRDIIADLPRRCPDAVALFDWVLERMEVFGERPVRLWCAYLALARAGMSSRELSDLLAGKLGPQAARTALLIERGMRRYLQRRGQQLDFYHGQLRRAVVARCLGDGPTACHADIAEYLATRWGEPNAHALSELPYHLHEAADFDSLAQTLGARDFLARTCDVLSPEAMLESLEWELTAARTTGRADLAAGALAAWGCALGYRGGGLESRVELLTRSGRLADAIAAARAARPAARACMLLTGLAHRQLDDGDAVAAREVLRELLASGLPCATEGLPEHLRLVERFVALGELDALGRLRSANPRTMATQVLGYLVGTQLLREDVLRTMLGVLEDLHDPYWRGVCLLTLCCRAVRRGLPGAEPALRGIQQAIRATPAGDSRLALLEAVAGSYRWLAHLGLAPVELGLLSEEDLAFARRTDGLGGGHDRCFRSAQPGVYPALPATQGPAGGAQALGTFRFIAAAGKDSAADESVLVADVLARAVTAVLGNAADPPALAAAVAPGGDLALARLIGSLRLPGLNDPSQAGPPINTVLDELRRVPEDARTALLAGLLVLGHDEGVWQVAQSWETQSAGTPALAGVYRTIGSLKTWKRAGEFLAAASGRLKQVSPAPDHPAIVELVRALVCHGRIAEIGYWLAYLVSQIAPAMTLNLRHHEEPATVRTYALLNSILSELSPERPLAGDVEQTKARAATMARELLVAYPSLGIAMREEFAMRESPALYLADRLIALAAEDRAWREPDAEASQRHMSEVLRLETVGDDRQRKRSWCCWLGMLSSDPSPDQVRAWREGIDAAQAVPLPHEELLGEMVGAQVARHSRRRETAKALPALIGAMPDAEANVAAGKLADAGIRGFDQSPEQAEVLAYAAEAVGYMDLASQAIGFIATADALEPGFGAFAEGRVRLAELALHGVPQALDSWSDVPSFDEAFHAVLHARVLAGDIPGLIQLTASLRRSGEAWRDLLLGLAGAPHSARESERLAGCLLRAIRQSVPPTPLEGDRHGQGK